MASIFIRTLAVYAVLIAVMRFSGKRQIGQMQVSELVTAFLLSNLASTPLTDPSVPLLYAVVPIVTLICMEVFFSFLTTKINFVKKLLDGKPSIIVNKGKIDISEMSKMRMSLEDLLCELHIAGYSAMSEIEYAILEPNGKLAFFPCESNDNTSGIAHPVIIDGEFVSYAVSDIGKNEKWVAEQLKKRDISSISAVFLMTVDDNEKIQVIKKEDCLT